MPYRLTMEVQSETAVERFSQDFDSVEDARAYAEQQVNGDIFWTERDTHFDGLAPGYALRIEEFATE